MKKQSKQRHRIRNVSFEVMCILLWLDHQVREHPAALSLDLGLQAPECQSVL